MFLDLSFEKGGAVDEYIGVNGDTAFEKTPKSETGGVMPAILRRFCALRGAVGPDVPIYIRRKWMSRMPLGDFMWHGRKHLRLRTG